MAQPPYAGKIEALPTPFTSQLHCLIVSKRFYEANSELVEKLWETIVRIRRSRDQVAQQKTVRRP
jgi:polar amino acid transport system substrate-binding protein